MIPRHLLDKCSATMVPPVAIVANRELIVNLTISNTTLVSYLWRMNLPKPPFQGW